MIPMSYRRPNPAPNRVRSRWHLSAQKGHAVSMASGFGRPPRAAASPSKKPGKTFHGRGPKWTRARRRPMSSAAGSRRPAARHSELGKERRDPEKGAGRMLLKAAVLF